MRHKGSAKKKKKWTLKQSGQMKVHFSKKMLAMSQIKIRERSYEIEEHSTPFSTHLHILI